MERSIIRLFSRNCSAGVLVRNMSRKLICHGTPDNRGTSPVSSHMATSTPFSMEYLPNIRQLVLLIPIDTANLDITSKLFLNRKTKQLFTQDPSQDSDLLISVPGSIPLTSIDLPILGSEVENFPQTSRIDNVIILQFRNVEIDCDASLPVLLLAKSLQSICVSLSCSSCSHELKNFESDQFDFKDLPNEHWLELVDCWSCHDNEFAPIAERALNQKLSDCHNDHGHNGHEHNGHGHCTNKSYQQLNNSSHGLILPPPGKIYLGTSYILMNKHNFSLISCPQCHTHLAELVQGEHIKIYRDAIRFHVKDAITFPLESFATILMHRIIDTIDNHSTFHFILKAPGRKKAYLRPFNWNLRIQQPNGTWKPAFKLGYTQLAEASEASHTEAEIINCTPAQYDQTVQLLDQMHSQALFSSTIKIADDSPLKLTYLINQ